MLLCGVIAALLCAVSPGFADEATPPAPANAIGTLETIVVSGE